MNSPLDSEVQNNLSPTDSILQAHLESVARASEANRADAMRANGMAPLLSNPIDEIPHLEFENGRKTNDSSATAAVMALQPSLAASKTSALENLYLTWLHPESEKKQARRHDVAEAARKPIAILRQEITELATALQESMARENAAKIQSQFTAEYLRLVEDNRKLREFLFQNFEGELQQATSLNKPLLELVKELLLRRPPASAGDNRG